MLAEPMGGLLEARLEGLARLPAQELLRERRVRLKEEDLAGVGAQATFVEDCASLDPRRRRLCTPIRMNANRLKIAALARFEECALGQAKRLSAGRHRLHSAGKVFTDQVAQVALPGDKADKGNRPVGIGGLYELHQLGTFAADEIDIRRMARQPQHQYLLTLVTSQRGGHRSRPNTRSVERPGGFSRRRC